MWTITLCQVSIRPASQWASVWFHEVVWTGVKLCLSWLLWFLVVCGCLRSGFAAPVTITVVNHRCDPLCFFRYDARKWIPGVPLVSIPEVEGWQTTIYRRRDDAPLLPQVAYEEHQSRKPKVQKLGSWQKDDPGVKLTIVSENDSSFVKTRQLGPGEAEITIHLPPGRYSITGAVTIQRDESFDWDTQESVAPEEGTVRLDPLPYPAQSMSRIDEKGTWQLVSLDDVYRGPSSDGMGMTWHYKLTKRYTYQVVSTTLTHVQSGVPDRATIVLLTDIDELGRLAGARVNQSEKWNRVQEVTERTTVGTAKTMTATVVASVLKEPLKKGWAAVGASTAAVNLIYLSVFEPTRQIDSEVLEVMGLESAVCMIIHATVHSTRMEIGLAVTAGLAIHQLDKWLVRRELRRKVAEALFDDIDVRYVWGEESQITHVEINPRGDTVSGLYLAAPVSEQKLWDPVPACLIRDRWNRFPIPHSLPLEKLNENAGFISSAWIPERRGSSYVVTDVQTKLAEAIQGGHAFLICDTFVIGRRKMERLVQTLTPINEPSQMGKLDCVFCIDKSGSMEDDIESVRKASDRIIQQLDDFAVKNDISLQVGLVTYSRHDDPDWINAWRLTSDTQKMRDNILDIKITDLGLGASGNEDLYGAMMYAMDMKVGGKQLKMGWRHGAAKIAIPIGDEPAADPDWEGRTLSVVTRRADELDPVHVYPLILPKSGPSFWDPTVRSMERLAEATGGVTTQVESAAELPDAIVAAVKLAVRRHRAEVWREENPPYGLFAAAGAISTLAVLGLGMAVVAQWRRRRQLEKGAAATLSARTDPELTGQSMDP